MWKKKEKSSWTNESENCGRLEHPKAWRRGDGPEKIMEPVAFIYKKLSIFECSVSRISEMLIFVEKIFNNLICIDFWTRLPNGNLFHWDKIDLDLFEYKILDCNLHFKLISRET